jgi:hypothetical protein
MMKNWLQSNWAAGTAGRRQVILAGTLLLFSATGASYATWITQRAPLRYVTVLEGEDAKGHFFTTLAIASPNPWQARRLALAAAKGQGLDIVGVEEVKATGPAPHAAHPGVLKAPWSKIYFPTEHEHCQHEHDR